MQQFKLVLQHEKRKLYDRFALFLFTLNGIGASIFLLYANAPAIGKYEDLGLLVAALAASICCMVLVSKRKINNSKILFAGAAAIILLFWIVIGYWWIGLLITGLIFLYRISQKEPIVLIGSAMIRYPSFPVKKIGWPDLNNLVLKDDLLTIDLKNNKIIQQMIDPDKTSVDEKEFNEFCNKQLRSAKPGDQKPGALDILGEAGNALSALDP